MRSETIKIYQKSLNQGSLTLGDILFVDAVYLMCERNYDAGGDLIVETYVPSDIVREFKTLDEVKERIGLLVQQELNCREGTDDDHELTRWENYKNWVNIFPPENL